MLKTMRKKAKLILWILAIVIIPLFIWWGSGPTPREGKARQYAGKISGNKVTWDEFYSVMHSIQNRLRLIYGNNYNQVATHTLLEEQTWERLLLVRVARQEGITAENEEIIKEIKNTPYFQKDGKFDSGTYNLVLANFFRVNGAGYEKEVHDTLLISKLYKKTTSGVNVTEEELKEEYSLQNEKAIASYLLFEFQDFKSQVKIEDNELVEYYQKNSRMFKKPEQINLEYTGISFAELEPSISIAEEEIKKYYDSHLDEFKKLVQEEREQEPTEKESPYRSFEEVKDEIQRKLTHESTGKKAKEIVDNASDDLIENLDLESVAKKNNLIIKETGFFSPEDQLPAIGWSPQFMQVAFRLEPAEISEPVQTSNGYYILKLKEKKSSYIPELSEVSQKVKDALENEKARNLCLNKATVIYNKIKEALQNPNLRLEEVAKGFSMEVKRTPPFSRRGYVPGPAGSPELAEKIFSSTLKDIMPPQETRVGYTIMRLDEVQPIDESKFAEEKSQFKEQLIQQKKVEAFQTWLTKLKEKVKIESNLQPPAEETS